MEANSVPLDFFTVDGTRLARIDAEYAASSLVANETGLASIEHRKLKDIAVRYTGPSLNAAYIAEHSMCRYISIDDVDVEDGLTFVERLLYKDRPSRAKYVVQQGDVLVSNVRPNRGAVSLASPRLAGALASSGFTVVRSPEDQLLTPEYLFAFLKTGTAVAQLVRRTRGSMYPAVLGDDVRDVLVPVPPKALLEQVTQRVAAGVASHDAFFSRWEELQRELEVSLSQWLGAPPPSPLEPGAIGADCAVCASSDFFSAQGAQRFDAEFFRRCYLTFASKLARSERCAQLGTYYVALSGRAQGKPAEEICYLRQSVLTNCGINWSATSIEPGQRSPMRGRVREGDILLACTAHEIYYVGRKVDFVRDVPAQFRDNNCCVPDIMILRPRGGKPEHWHGAYVAAFLRSPWGLHQVQRCIRGLRGGHVYGSDLERFVQIPLPDRAWLRAFEEAARDAEGKRVRGKAEIALAIRKTKDWLAVALGGQETALRMAGT